MAQPAFDAGPARTFLQRLLEHAPQDLWFALWTFPAKQTAWIRASEWETALTQAARRSETQDVYIGTYMMADDLGARTRGTEDDVAALFGLHVDVDIQDPDAHKKANLPPEFEDGQRLINAAGLQPSLLVMSGHGLQAWWLFREPWVLETMEERAEAKALLGDWQRTIRTLAQREGWTVDSTQDLVRVLRLPGTKNRKNKAKVVDVDLWEVNDVRWEPSDFREHIIPEELPAARATRSAAPQEPKAAPAVAASLGGIVYNPGADVPKTKFDALVSVEPKFGASWERKRSGLESASEYDLSLATFAAMAEWSDQEIANLIIAHRRKHNDQPEKALRADYVEKWVIRKARESVTKQRAADNLDDVIQRVEATVDDEDEDGLEAARQELIATVAAYWSVPITGLVKFRSSPPEYRLRTSKGDISLGKAEALLSQPTMRARILDATGVVIPKVKEEKWFNQVQALVKAAVDDDAGFEATEQGAAYTWLDRYLSDKPPCTLEELKERDEGGDLRYPYTDDGAVWIFGEDLRSWLATSRNEKVSAKEMGLSLRSVGAQAKLLPLTVKGRKTTRGVWHLPGQFYAPVLRQERVDVEAAST